MLRYSHKLPKYYEENFIKGFMSNGNALPKNWKKSVKLMDLFCLLSLCSFNSKENRPQMIADVVNLIKYTIEHME